MEKINQEKPEEIKTKILKDIDFNFTVWMKVNNYSLGTIKNYHVAIRNMIANKPSVKIKGKKKELAIISKKERYISPEKIKKYLSLHNTLSNRAAIKLFLVFLEDMHNIKIKTFRYVRLRKKSNALEVISKESFNKILEVIRDDLKLLIKIKYYLGLRLGETIMIQTNWFNWKEWELDKSDHGMLKVRKAKRNKERFIPINPILMQEILNYIPKRENGSLKIGLLFDFKYKKYVRKKKKKFIPRDVIERKYIAKTSCFIQKHLAIASLKAIDKKIKTHALRSSRATHLDESKMSPFLIRDFLGHENVSTTSRYIVNTPVKLKNAMKKVDDYK